MEKKINLSRVKSVCYLSWFALIFVILAIAGILYLYFTNWHNIDCLTYSNMVLVFLILNFKDHASLQILSTQPVVFADFCVMIIAYILFYFGFIFLPTIAAIIASKVTGIKGYGRTAIFTTPAVIIWLVLAPIVWLVSIIVLISVSITYINRENSVSENNNLLHYNRKNGNYYPYKENQPVVGNNNINK